MSRLLRAHLRSLCSQDAVVAQSNYSIERLLFRSPLRVEMLSCQFLSRFGTCLQVGPVEKLGPEDENGLPDCNKQLNKVLGVLGCSVTPGVTHVPASISSKASKSKNSCMPSNEVALLKRRKLEGLKHRRCGHTVKARTPRVRGLK